MNKAMELLRGLVSEIERQTCEHEETHRGGAIWEICDSCGAKWADDEGGKPEFEWPESVEKAREFLAAHPAVEQAGGDEREEFEKIHTVPRGIMWNEEKSQYVRVHEKHCSLRTWNSFVALWAGWMARAALAQPSPKSGYYSDQEWINAGCPPEQPSPAQAEQAEAERPEVVARVVHSTPVVLDHCAPLNANDEMMTVAQHAASVARWAEMFNRVEQERDAALAEVERLRESKGDPSGSFDRCMKMMYERDENAKQLEVALARVAELERQEPVAWVEVIDRDYGPYNFHGKRLLPKGKHQLYAAPVAHVQQLHDLDAQCRDDVARALGLRPSQERGFAWSYLLASIKSCVKASEDAAQAQHSVPAYVSYTTRPAESLAGIALRQLKEESRWVEIRDINAPAFPDMQSHSYYPAGTVIKLPAAAPGKEGV
ncbi:LysM peptidoglycan-binding domain-containing protein [Pseudomonas aeruginosa]|uniref:LysM peptidoglycan-binding domain-containing protein n=1 Tax=Pseudomonas aeruginosa TaxID=287 RepID=UPI003AE195D3